MQYFKVFFPDKVFSWASSSSLHAFHYFFYVLRTPGARGARQATCGWGGGWACAASARTWWWSPAPRGRAAPREPCSRSAPPRPPQPPPPRTSIIMDDFAAALVKMLHLTICFRYISIVISNEEQEKFRNISVLINCIYIWGLEAVWYISMSPLFIISFSCCNYLKGLQTLKAIENTLWMLILLIML